MNLIHISYSDKVGGSARSAYRIHKGLENLGIKSFMFVGYKVRNDNSVEFISGNKFFQTTNRIFGKIGDVLGLQFITYFISFRILFTKEYKESDAIQLYNLHGKYFSLIILYFMKNKKVYLRLSDMWSFTGNCAYAYDCDKWLNGCGKCHNIHQEIDMYYDTTGFMWRVKKFLFSRLDLTVIAPSKWMLREAQKSPIFQNAKFHYIPNGIDIQAFKPKDKDIARLELNINRDKNIVMFSADSLKNKRKGSTYLLEALKKIKNKNKILILLVGHGEMSIDGFEVVNLGDIKDDRKMAASYSAADVFVLPTLADNLPNSIIESMSCGTPVVSFNIGGVPDILKHKETGWLADYKNSDSLAEGIEYILFADIVGDTISKKCREIVENDYSQEIEIEKFKNLYYEGLK